MALESRKCQSNEVDQFDDVALDTAVTIKDDAIRVTDGGASLVFTPFAVTAPDGTVVAHESRGGTLSSAWAGTVGRLYVEVSHVGPGATGGELLMVVTDPASGDTRVALGDLVTDIPEGLAPETVFAWAASVDLALGLLTGDTLDSGTKDDVEAFHQRLLGVLHA